MQLPFSEAELASASSYAAEFQRRRALWQQGVDWLHTVPQPSIRRIYEMYPLLFAPAFPEITQDRLRSLSCAGHLLAESIFVFDMVIDEDADPLERSVLVAKGQSLQLEAVHALAQLFPAESSMWTQLREDFIAYFAAIRNEREIPLDRLDEDTATTIARSKAAVARSCVAAMGVLADRPQLASTLASVVTDFYQARQMWDDLTDWRNDLANDQRTLLLARAIQSLGPDSPRDAHAVGAELYYGGHAEHVLAIGEAALARARDTLTELGVTIPFGRLLDDLGAQLGDTRAALAEMLERKRKGSGARALALPPKPATSQDGDATIAVMWSAASWLATEAPRAFAEARHWIRFPEGMGLQSALFQSGDVFQRAVIADALCDLPDSLAASFRPVIEHELAYLLRSRICERCGWSYLTDLVEEPADADTLAQILQVAVRMNRATPADFAAPVELLFAACSHEDGSFETWILPPPGERDEVHRRQAQLVASAWGHGPDPEVMANLLYALALWDPERFADRIAAGSKFLVERQHPTGAWTASWYWGPFYSTYVHVRLLARIPEAAAAVTRAAQALLAGQGRDGSWSYREVARPLDTAHALLALLAAGPLAGDEAAVRASIRRGIAALLAACRDDGGWSADPFIRMNCGRASGSEGRELAFGSRTLTTAYVLKAAASAFRALDGEERTRAT